AVLDGLSDGGCRMNSAAENGDPGHVDTAPGDAHDVGYEGAGSLVAYLIGLGLASLLTIVSFFVAQTTLGWQPTIPVALAVRATAQVGVRLVVFLRITTGPDNVNNVLALAFGVLIVFLVVVGSLWIIAHMNQNMMPMDQLMQMQR